MRLKTCILQARPIKFDPWGSFPTRGTDMISKSAHRRIRRARTGGPTSRKFASGKSNKGNPSL